MAGKLRPALLNQVLEELNIMERQAHPAFGKAKRDGIRELVNRELAKVEGNPTNADRIRAMGDEELAEWMLKNISCDKEAHMCLPEMYKESGKCNGNCRAGHLAYLRQPEKEDTSCLEDT